MIGKNVIEIGPEDFLKGMTSSPETSDGGFSPETTAVNITSRQESLGILYAPTDITDKSTNLNGNIVATCSDPDSGVGVFKYIVTATGRFISTDSSNVLTVRRTSAGAKTYQFPTTDVVVYKNALYATSTNDITKSTGANLATTFDESWWDTTMTKSALSTGVPHPMLVFEDYLWIADGNKLHKTDGSTGTEGFLTLIDGLVIQSLAIDPGTGKMLISATDGPNGSDTLPRQSKIYVYDGFSSKPSRAVIVDDMVTEMYPLGGVVFMFYGQNVGYWNGSGITFLRRLANVTLSGTSLVYKHRVTNVGKVLYIADGVDLLCFEDTLPGGKKWYVNQRITASFNSYLDVIFNAGSNIIGVGYDSNGSTPKFAVFDRSTRGTGLLNFYSKKYNFERPIKVRELYIEYAGSVPNGTTMGAVTLYNQNLSTVIPDNIANNSGSAAYSVSTKLNPSLSFRKLQLKYSNSGYTSNTQGIRRILISYDPVE